MITLLAVCIYLLGVEGICLLLDRCAVRVHRKQLRSDRIARRLHA